MTTAQRWWLIVWLLAVAIALPLYFFEYSWGYSHSQRELFGILVPVVMIIAAGYLTLDRRGPQAKPILGTRVGAGALSDDHPRSNALTPTVRRTTFTQSFEKLWRGQQSLPKAFWGFFLLGSVLVAPVAAMVLGAPFIIIGQRQAALPVVFIVLIVYPLFAAVGVWRSANAYLMTDKNAYALRVLYVVGAKIALVIFLLGIFQRATGITFSDIVRRVSH